MYTLILLCAVGPFCPQCSPYEYEWERTRRAAAEKETKSDLALIAEKIGELTAALNKSRGEAERPLGPPTQNLNHTAEITELREKIESLQKQIHKIGMDSATNENEIENLRFYVRNLEKWDEIYNSNIVELNKTTKEHERHIELIMGIIVWSAIVITVTIVFLFIIWASTPSKAADPEDEEEDSEEELGEE